jgi:DNA-binding MarR family transcriptional regulator
MVVQVRRGKAALDPETIDLATLAWLAGAAANEMLLREVRGTRHPKVRNAHGYVFQHLLGGSRTVGELAKLLGVTQQAASKLVVELEQLGYVERQPDETDKRVRRVVLTGRGAGLVERARDARAALEAKVLKRVGPKGAFDARRALVALLQISGGLGAVTKRRVKPPST